MLEKEKYEQPMVLVVAFEKADVVTASLTQGDNVIDDNFFD